MTVPNYKNQNGETPLHKAAKNGSNEAVELLLSRGAFVNAKAKNEATPLHFAVWHSLKSEDCVTVKTLLKHKADSNARDYYGETPLHMAARNGCNEAAKLLLSHGALIDAKENNGATPLHFAVWHSLKSEDCVTVKTLLKHKADSNAKDYYGETPLHVAVRNGCNEAAKLLLSRGALVNAKANNGETPLHIAAKNGYNEAAKLLVSHGAFVNAKANNEMTPIDLAVWHSRQSEDCWTLQTLLECNADCSAKDDSGQTPLPTLCVLPYEVIKDIVYKLDFKEAVMTSLLCKGFRYLWHGIQDVRICDNSLRGLKKVDWASELKPDGSCEMVNVVPKVRSFELVVTNKCSKEKMELAVNWLLEREVKKVVIIYDDSGEITRYPTSLFNIESLVSLSLETPARLTMPTSIRLPYLKSFYFNMRNYQSADLVNAVVKACPVLEDVDISIELAGVNAAIPCHLKLENSSLRWIQIMGSCTIGNGVVVGCEAQCLRFLSLVTLDILILPNKNFKELRVLFYQVTSLQHFQEFISVLNSCELLEELQLMFIVTLDPRKNWCLDIGNKKLKIVKMRGGLYIGKDMHLNISFRTPELNILHIDFRSIKLRLQIQWIEACKLARRQITPTPFSEKWG